MVSDNDDIGIVNKVIAQSLQENEHKFSLGMGNGGEHDNDLASGLV
jgi:hypothetical protein